MLFKFLIDSKFWRYEFFAASRFLCFLCLAWFPQTSTAQEDWFGDSTQLFIWQKPGPGYEMVADITGNKGVSALLAMGDTLVVGGSYQIITNGSIIRSPAMWYGNSWHSMAGGLDGSVLAIEKVGQDLYFGGNFTGADGVESRGIIRWSGNQWHPVGNGVVGTVNTISHWDNQLYLGGNFQSIVFNPGSHYVNIVRYDILLDSWVPLQTGSQSILYSSVAYAGALWVSGLWSSPRIWTGQEWSLNTGIFTNDPQTQVSTIYKMVAYQNQLYLGGNFRNLAGIDSANGVAMQENGTWFALGKGIEGDSGNASNTSIVYGLLPWEENVFLGGSFSKDSQSVFNHRLVRYHHPSRTYKRVGEEAFDQQRVVSELCFYQGYLVAGGGFRNVGPDSTLHSLVFFKPQPVTAAKSPETEISLAVFRNPANGLVRVAGLPADLEATYSVVDIRGRLVEKGNVSTQGELGPQRLPNGLYHILINTRNQLYNLKLAVL